MLELKIAFFIFINQGFIQAFDHGVQYIYDYQTSVTTGDWSLQNDQKSLGYRMSAELHLMPIWENSEQGKLIEIELKNAVTLSPEGLKNPKKHTSEVLSISPFFVHVAGGKVLKYFSDPQESTDSKNFKKALASILQYSRESHSVTEADLSGICDVVYTKSEKTITKSKRNCRPYGKKSLSHLTKAQDATISQISDTVYDFLQDKYDIFEKLSTSDVIQMYSNLWRANTVSIRAKTELNLKSANDNKEATITADNISAAIGSLETKKKRNLVENIQIPEEFVSEQKPKEIDLKKSINALKKLLHSDNLSKTKSASAFLNLLKDFHGASKEEIKKVMQSKDFKPFLFQILDIIAFTKTDAAIEAAFEELDFINGDINLLDRYLLALSLVPRPTPLIIKKLLTVLEKPSKNEKIKASLLSALGALTKKFDEQSEGDDKNKKISNLVKDHLENGLASCETDNCKLMYLRGFRNAALVSSVDLLTKISESGGQAALESLHALRNIGIKDFPSMCETLAKNVFYELKSKQESTTRILAADLLFDCRFSDGTLGDLLLSLADEGINSEFSTAIFSRLKDRMGKEESLRSEVEDLLRRDKRIMFLFNLHQEGSSISLTEELLSSSEVNSTYSFFMEMLPGGLLKRSSFDVNALVPSTNEKLSILDIGMFAGGLGSVAGSSSTESADEVVTAGMELTFLGVALRPYVFFEGSSELMSYVWSGTGSEPTPALQGNFLISDIDEVRYLHNGLPVRAKLKGAISIDISGSIQISLWNRNSQSEVKNRAAFLITGSISIGPDPYLLEESFAFRSKSSINFMTNLDFYNSPFSSCFRMDQPSFIFWSRKISSLSIRNKKVFHERRKEKRTSIPSKSFHMHKKNDRICTILLSS